MKDELTLFRIGVKFDSMNHKIVMNRINERKVINVFKLFLTRKKRLMLNLPYEKNDFIILICC
jgi:hypothetical protein